mmetsp:Transcript_14232/g.28398  ORF Transcript_14232/g.28398 Transcript_14232/m.28398 type:complete len:135 (-) Transcript_14232:89-493(-)
MAKYTIGMGRLALWCISTTVIKILQILYGKEQVISGHQKQSKKDICLSFSNNFLSSIIYRCQQVKKIVQKKTLPLIFSNRVSVQKDTFKSILHTTLSPNVGKPMYEILTKLHFQLNYLLEKSKGIYSLKNIYLQ